MKLTLVEPSLERADQFLSLVEELKGVGRPLAGTEGLDHDAMTDYVAQLSRLKAGVGLESWQVPMSTFWLIDEARGLVGLSRIRHRLTPTLRLEGGAHRLPRSAFRPSDGIRVSAPGCLASQGPRFGIARVLLTCDSDNFGSRRIIEKNGGQLEIEAVSTESGKLIRRYWIDLP